LNANLGAPFSWFGDNETVLVKLLPSDRKPLLDAKKDLPAGPIISNASGAKSQNRTYPDMLKTKMTRSILKTSSLLNYTKSP